MADGYARSTGKPGVVLVTSGPGATNTVTGLLTALMDSAPIIVICGQTISPMLGKDAFQEADVTGITYPVVKHSYLVKDGRDIPRIVREAFHVATTGRARTGADRRAEGHRSGAVQRTVHRQARPTRLQRAQPRQPRRDRRGRATALGEPAARCSTWVTAR